MTTYDKVNNAFNKAYHTHLTFKYADTAYVTKAARDLVKHVTNLKNSTCLRFDSKAELRCAEAWLNGNA